MRLLLMLLVTLFFSLTISVAQSLPNRQEQVRFLKWYITQKRLVPIADTNLRLSQNLINTEDLNRIFSETKQSFASRKFLNRQASVLTKKLTLDSAFLKELNWQNSHAKSNRFISNLSLPIFSLDRKLVIIAYEIYCGIDCGEQSTDIFTKNKKDKWIRSKVPVKVLMF